VLAIKQKLEAAPVSLATQERRKFINEKDGYKVKNQSTKMGLKIIDQNLSEIPEALKMAVEAVEASKPKKKVSKQEYLDFEQNQ
jgi:hypothetical protein